MSASRHSSLRSSIDDGPSKPTSVGDPGKMTRSPSRHPSNPTHPSSLEGLHTTPRSLPSKQLSSAHAIPHGSLRSAVPNPVNSTHVRPSSPRSTKASSISKASPSFVAAHGEFNVLRNSTGGNGNRACVAQMDIHNGRRGSKNPHGLSLGKTTGYFPQGPEIGTGSTRQSQTTKLNDRPSLEDLLRMIAAERLHHMPQKGSNWDRSIRALESMFMASLRYLEVLY